MPAKSASIVQSPVTAKMLLSPLAVVSCSPAGDVSSLAPGTMVYIAIAKERRGNDYQGADEYVAPDSHAASIVWGKTDQNPQDLVAEAVQDLSMFLGYGLRDSPRPPPPDTAILQLPMRQFVRLTQEAWGETMRCLKPYASLGRYAGAQEKDMSNYIRYKGQLYRRAAIYQPSKGNKNFTAEDLLKEFGQTMSPEQAQDLAARAHAPSNARRRDELLEDFNKAIEGHGVEALRSEKVFDNYYGDVVALYVNTGDAYSATIVFDVDEVEFYLTSYGDWLEAWEHEHSGDEVRPVNE